MVDTKEKKEKAPQEEKPKKRTAAVKRKDLISKSEPALDCDNGSTVQ